MKAVLQYYRVFIVKLGFLFLLFQLFRLIFVWANAAYLSDIEWKYFLYGIKFDASAIAYSFSGFFLLEILPFPKHIRNHQLYKRLTALFFWAGWIFSTLINLTDVVYFRYTLKRTTVDIIDLLLASTDILRLFPQFLKNYWYLFAAFTLFLFLTIKMVKYIEQRLKYQEEIPFLKKAVTFVFWIALFILFARGGFQLKPLTVIDAYKYAQANDINAVLNSSFVFLKSLENQRSFHIPKYFSGKQELQKYFNPVQKIQPAEVIHHQPNVVLLILESFGKEYISYFNHKHHLTPFLDSLLGKSAVFRYSFANGRKSIEALPSILSSIPSLMDEPYITSPYANNHIESLPKKLKQQGYFTAFFHGADNGSMNFDAFTSAAGIEQYFGRSEYPNSARDFDGNWGIFDEPFLQFCSQKINHFPQPFFAVVFTLSSHHPYSVPALYKDVFTANYDALPIAPTIQYVDFSLKKFFKTIRKSSWYENTLFIITADHTSLTKDKRYKTSLGVYEVPIAFYYPGKELRNILDTNKIIEHKDIFPTVMSMLNQEDTIWTMGKNIMADKTVGMNYLNQSYQFVFDTLLVRFYNDKIQEIYAYQSDTLLVENIYSQINADDVCFMENKVKAIVQTYWESLKNNQMTYISNKERQ